MNVLVALSFTVQCWGKWTQNFRNAELFSSLHLRYFNVLPVVMCKQPPKKAQTSSIQASVLFLALLRELSTNIEKTLEVSALGAYLRQMIQESVIVPSQAAVSIYLYQEKENRFKQRNGLASPTQGTTTSSYTQGERLLIHYPDHWNQQRHPYKEHHVLPRTVEARLS